jgi:hypothetical protein
MSYGLVIGNKEERMKYICLGYLEPGKFEGMTENERNAVAGRMLCACSFIGPQAQGPSVLLTS